MAIDKNMFDLACYAWLLLAVIIHVLMFFITAPFGRHTSTRWGAAINNKLAWFLMECPSLVIMSIFLFFGQRSFHSFVWILFVFWIIHYTNRILIYPLRIRATEKKMPVLILVFGLIFNAVNAGFNGYYLGELAEPGQYQTNWAHSWNFIAGGVLFVSGLMINWIADGILINLRKPGETGYKIPRGFLFEYVSSPNLLGEVIEWAGFALMAWNLPALTFMVWTFANLVPRAKNHHDWYRAKFPDYPKNRKIIFPYLF